MNTYELTRLTTQDLSKADIVTDSYIIAKQLGRKHDVIKKSIQRYKPFIEEFGRVRLVDSPFQTAGGIQTLSIYELNEGQATLLMTLFDNSPKVLNFKVRLVKAFLMMKHELTARVETRFIGKRVRNDLTKMISENIPEGTFKTFAYGNYTKLIYKKVIGKTVKKYKEELELPEKAKIRDYLTFEQLEKVQEIESKIANIIEFSDLPEKELYKKVKTFVMDYNIGGKNV